MMSLLPRLALPCTLLLLVAIVTAASSGASPTQPEPAASAATQWEFASLKVPTDTPNNKLGSQILKLGREGWELVSVENFSKDGTTTHTAFYFKRQL